jgi:hypothetical protein
MIKYLAVAAVAKLISRFNFAYRGSCLSIAYPVGKLYLTDDTRSRLILLLKVKLLFLNSNHYPTL